LLEDYDVKYAAYPDTYQKKIDPELQKRFIPLQKLKAKSNNLLNEWATYIEFKSIFKMFAPDIILGFTIKPNIWGGLAAFHSHITFIPTVTGLGYTFIHRSIRTSITQYLYKPAFRNCPFVVFHNSDDRDLFINKTLVSSNKTKVFSGSGVVVNYIHQDRMKEDNTFVFLFTGRLLYYKGVIDYIRAARLVSEKENNITFLLLGMEDQDNPNLIPRQALISELEKSNVRFLSDDEISVKSALEQCDVFVLPSYREGMPRATLEAMAMGKPIITTDTAGCRDTVIDGKNGFLVPVKDPDALASTMIKMYNLPESQRENMGIKSREMVEEKFADGIIVEQYLRLINSVI